MLGSREPHVHQGDQTLSTREDFCVAVFGQRPEHFQGLIERAWHVVLELGGLHADLVPSLVFIRPTSIDIIANSVPTAGNVPWLLATDRVLLPAQPRGHGMRSRVTRPVGSVNMLNNLRFDDGNLSRRGLCLKLGPMRRRASSPSGWDASSPPGEPNKASRSRSSPDWRESPRVW